MSYRQTVDFLLYDWLDVEGLRERPRFAEHSRETFDSVLDTCERIAREKYAPFNRLVDTEEPRFDGEKVILPRATHEAHEAYVASGMLSAAQDYEEGGMQLPYTIEAAAGTFFATASVSIGGGLLTAPGQAPGFVEDLAPYLDALDRHPRVGVCLDTCHVFAAGAPLDEPGGTTRTLDRLVEVAGPGRLRLVHANDSKDPRGSLRDRHERVGEGHIGEAAFAELFAHPATNGVPFVAETPGSGDVGSPCLPLLKKLRDG